MTKQKKTNLYKVTLRCKHSDWNENISVYENLLPTLRNSDKAEETCNTAPKLHIKLQTQLQIDQFADGRGKLNHVSKKISKLSGLRTNFSGLKNSMK